MNTFFQEVREFNQTFGLPVKSGPVVDSNLRDRLVLFKKIISDEVNEVDEIIAKLDGETIDPLEVLTDVADWLGDIVVYCTSESVRLGIPMEDVLRLIMHSQYSKLVDSKPLIRDGKVQKGPNFVAPEPRIRALLNSIRYAKGLQE
jgi:hypothetical protein